MTRKVELLAPAGNYDAFLAAVENGADAVYLGGRLFNARQFAGNFDSEQLKRAVDYAHARGCRIYVTMNTLIADSEMEEAIDFTGEIYEMGADGIIVQDTGFAGLVKRIFPDLDLHASTQMTIYNLEGVRALEKMGFKRAVLARELSLNEINYISQNTSLEIEVFVHGALCISYSGQCLMSSLIGGRSGNRGKCAQPCRLKYSLVGRTQEILKDMACGYLLSPKDLCSLELLKDIVDSGASSLKIEGRMRTPEYVATVVRIYRKYLDRLLSDGSSRGQALGLIDEEDLNDLARIFNRGGLYHGYLKGKSGKSMMCFEKPKNWGIYIGKVLSYNKKENTVKVKLEGSLSEGDGIEVWNGEDESPGNIVTEIKVNGNRTDSVAEGQTAVIGSISGRIEPGNKVYKTSDKKLMTFAAESFSGKFSRKVPVEGRIRIKYGFPVTFAVYDKDGNSADALSGAIPEKAVNKPLTTDRVREQLGKTGATPFEFSNIDVELDEDIVIPVSELNHLRRKALEELEVKRIQRYSRKMSADSINKKNSLLYFRGNNRKSKNDIKISLMLYGINIGFDYSSLGADIVYIPFSAYANAANRNLFSEMRKNGTEIFMWLPNVTKGNYEHFIRTQLNQIPDWGIDGVLIANLGSLDYFAQLPEVKVRGDIGLNIFNSFALSEYENLGFSSLTLSPELNLKQINSILGAAIEKEVIAYGRLPVMTSEYCPGGILKRGFDDKAACTGCRSESYKLKDRKGMEFPILCDKIDCRSTIFNSKVLLMIEYIDSIKSAGIDTIRINITDESIEEIGMLINMHKDALMDNKKALVKHRDEIEKIKSRGFTRGHFFRGV
ncbi:MAG: DUF3656 domain-containing protein [Clostridia bacterium]|nr:DUF3656 domain-containing protein [Clostridia bacterium]